MPPSDVLEKEASDSKLAVHSPSASGSTSAANNGETVNLEDNSESGDSEFEITSEVTHGEEDDDSIAADEDVADEEEVDSLMKESEMPLNDLLAAYGLSSSSALARDASTSDANPTASTGSGRSLRKRQQHFDTEVTVLDEVSTSLQISKNSDVLHNMAESGVGFSIAPKSARRENEVKAKSANEEDRHAVSGNPPSPETSVVITKPSVLVPHSELDLTSGNSAWEGVKALQDDEDEEAEDENTPGSYSPSLWCQALAGGASPPTYDSDEDEDYHPSVEGGGNWRGEVRVGEEYQATMPTQQVASAGESKLREKDSHLGYDCRLIWRPQGPDGRLSEMDVIRYEQTYTRAPTSTLRQFPDDEEALFWLLQANFDTDEALRRLQFKPVQPSEIVPFFEAWSENDCVAFEKGYITFNKNFRQIQQTRLRHKTVAELVHFYYLWKKTARHDDLIRYYRHEKKKPLHPGITDFMDCLVEEQQYSEMHHMHNSHQNHHHSQGSESHSLPGATVASPPHTANCVSSGSVTPSDANNSNCTHQSKTSTSMAIDSVTHTSPSKPTANSVDNETVSINLQELIDDPEVSISPRLRVVDPPPSSSTTAAQVCAPRSTPIFET